MQQRDFVKYLTFTGELKAVESAAVRSPNISSKWNFVVNYMIPEGTAVKPGDLLAGFDSSDLELKRLELEKKKEDAGTKIAQKKSETRTKRHDLELALAQAEKDYQVSKPWSFPRTPSSKKKTPSMSSCGRAVLS
ncbi:MAG: hypothetical protein ACE5JX_07670 [Acidobacteriota bacterium]